MAVIARPAPEEYAPYYETYLQHLSQGEDVLALLARQGDQVQAMVTGLGPRDGDHSYAPGKWTVKQVLGHLADAERVFVFRCVWFARGESAPLPGMDENLWARTAGAEARPLADLGREMAALRRVSLDFFAALPDEAWDRRGVASERVLSVRAVPWIIAGHERHHLEILREQYGIAAP